MRLLLPLCAIMLAVLVSSPPVHAKGPQGKPTVNITGGGVVANTDVGPNVRSIGGFNAKAIGDGYYGVWEGEYVRGQIQAKTVNVYYPDVTISSLHGKVVCIADLGNGVWEIRFEITHVGGAVPLNVGEFGSLFVKDGDPDMADENFSELSNPTCLEGGFTLENMIHGSIKVRADD